MNKELAKTLTTALVQFIDREIPEGTMCCSSAECEKIESSFKLGDFPSIEQFVKKKLLRLTEFEQELVNFYNKRSMLPQDKDGVYNRHDCEELLHESAKKLLELAKKELARRDEVITLNNLPPYDKGFQDGKAEALKDLPRWKIWGNGGCGNGNDIPIAIVRRGFKYELVSALGIQGEHYIMLSELEKLPGFKEG